MDSTASNTRAQAHTTDNVIPFPPRNFREQFFAVDRRMWAAVSKGDVNMMIAYLVMACGSAQNRTTKWSVTAIEKYTSISRGRARDAVQRLKDGNIIRQEEEGKHPLYSIVWDNIVDEPDWIWLPN